MPYSVYYVSQALSGAQLLIRHCRDLPAAREVMRLVALNVTAHGCTIVIIDDEDGREIARQEAPPASCFPEVDKQEL